MALTRIQPTIQRRAPLNPTRTFRVLCVEDEDTNWIVTEFSMRDKYFLTRASTAADVFGLLKTQRFDVILMDIQLSGSDLNGIDITKILKGRSVAGAPAYARDVPVTTAPIIFLTAYNARYTREELLQVGGDELIAKPIDFTRLSATMRLLAGAKN